jgi:hypothetical protein
MYWTLGLIAAGVVALMTFLGDVVVAICAISFLFLLLIGLPLLLCKPARRFVGYALACWGPLSLSCLVFQSFKVVAAFNGRTEAVVAICLGVFPVVPAALWVAFQNGEWKVCFCLLLYMLASPAASVGGLHLIEEKREH